VDDQLVATAAEAWCSPDVGFMMGVAVHPSHTGQGLGHRVCQFVASSLLSLYGTCALFVENYNAPAIALYRKLGFAHRDVTTLLPAV
jgi:predicted GNAT family acetyltransferase